MPGFYSVTPLIAFKDPLVMFKEQPTFLCAEVLFTVLAVLALTDAYRRHRGGLTLTACLVGGVCVDLLAVLHTEVGNFCTRQRLEP